MSVVITRTKLGQTTPKTPPINLIKSGILGTTIACHPSPHPDHIETGTAINTGFPSCSSEGGRTKVGRRGWRDFFFERRSFGKNLDK